MKNYILSICLFALSTGFVVSTDVAMEVAKEVKELKKFVKTDLLIKKTGLERQKLGLQVANVAGQALIGLSGTMVAAGLTCFAIENPGLFAFTGMSSLTLYLFCVLHETDKEELQLVEQAEEEINLILNK